VDASVWTSTLVPADSHHAASRAWLGQYLSEGHVVVGPRLLLVEVAGALARRTGEARDAERAVARLRGLRSARWIALTNDLVDHAAQLAATLRLRGADAVYGALADRLSIPLVTWDHEQLTRAAGRISVMTP
jgi:predicted nucleic acid-binding protein